MSSGLQATEQFLSAAGFDRAPWLAVGFASGIAAWFTLDNSRQWLGFLALCLAITAGASALMRSDGKLPYLRLALIAMPLALAAGCLVVWTKSQLAGVPPIARPVVAEFPATVLAREEQPADARVRLLLAMRDTEPPRVLRVRVNLPDKLDRADIVPGARIRLKARLMPPAPPMLPGGYNFARAAWFSGLAATGSVLGPVEIVRPAVARGWLSGVRASLSRHVQARLGGSSGAVAAALVTGDHGAIPQDDAQAMRDAGLAHLLSISGLHVSAVVAAAWFLALRLLALWPWLALRVRLPLVAAGAGALAGIGYTLLTGAQVPTVRSCVGALLVLGALALGREPLSLRMLAVAAFVVLLLWPESLVGPSFQMSFAAVMAIVALNGAEPLRAFLAPREEGWALRGLRLLAATLLTGFVIELVLMPIGLFHFHRAGLYGAFANVIAIPLTTLVTMPLVALALALDIVGAGWPVWWLAGTAIDAMLSLAHWIASRPGAVTVLPAMGAGSFALFVAGGLWLALWTSRLRLLGLLPVALGALSLATLRPPDILVTGDGHHIGVTGEGKGGLLVLRESRSSFVSDNLSELAGMDGERELLTDWPGARCNPDFCAFVLRRGGRSWQVLVSRSRDLPPERALAAACDRADIVIADRWLPQSCHPRFLKADRRLLSRTGGLAIDLRHATIRSVADGQGEHGWWRPPNPEPR